MGVNQNSRDSLRNNKVKMQLVDWAERAMYEGEFDDDHFDAIRCAVAKLGLADVKMFGLTLEDCEALLKRLGYSMRVDVVSV